MGNVRVVFLLHKVGGHVILWPAVRQQPQDSQGILGKSYIVYFLNIQTAERQIQSDRETNAEAQVPQCTNSITDIR